MPVSSSNYAEMKYPIASDPVNVHGDFKVLVDALNDILPPLGVSAFSLPVRNITGATLLIGTPVSISGSVSGKTTVEKYNPSSVSHNPNTPILGIVKNNIANNNDGVVVISGVLEMNTSSLGVVGTKVYIDANGSLVGERPSTGPARYVAVVAIPGTEGLLIVQAKGNGTWGALKDGLS
jgi:hypothetical protein